MDCFICYLHLQPTCRWTILGNLFWTVLFPCFCFVLMCEAVRCDPFAAQFSAAATSLLHKPCTCSIQSSPPLWWAACQHFGWSSLQRNEKYFKLNFKMLCFTVLHCSIACCDSYLCYISICRTLNITGNSSSQVSDVALKEISGSYLLQLLVMKCWQYAQILQLGKQRTLKIGK